ncbi:MAG TPA: helicase-related protein [Dissulfurispiraceae bacterium]|nr:helicase-related protein [Dissulfurispiraceae bacterium]
MRIDANSWYYSPDHGQLCQVIEAQTLWGETTCRVWLPGRDSVVRIPASRLKSLESAGTGSPDDIAYIAAAARVADALTQDVLLAPIESSVIPLPHQIRALSRAIANDRVRYLLADEVGLGKTIEAGLIMRELKLRGLVKRTLVIAPKGLVSQWVAEMRLHFHENFNLILPEDLRTLRRISAGLSNEDSGLSKDEAETKTQSLALSPHPSNAWQMFSQVVVPMDSVKPLDKRRGWSAAQVSEHNRERFEDLISAGWDLVIVDEAHRLGGSTDQVARFKLGQGLSEAAPYFLMLSATPHQGKTDAFHRLVSLIDAQEFPDISSVTRERVQPHVIRTEKRRAIDADGKPLFKPRRTQLAPVSWEERHRNQQLLYEAVTEYVREGYNQAMREKRSYIGFLMILMQRLVVSSTSAIKTTLERRLAVLRHEDSGLSQMQLLSEDSISQSSVLSPDDFHDLDGQEQIDVLLRTRFKALKNERAEVKLLLEAAARCEQAGPDAKAEALLDWLYRLQSEESDPELKALVFTEFVPTQEMLRRFLTERGFSVVCLNGSMDMEERKRVQEAFAKDVRILISTDAGGEGLNLQFCHVVINYDIPWNPMRLEQRIGRVDRIGQAHAVRAVNFVFEGSVEHRVREVLEQKLAVIFEEFGIDKTGDVLDSAQAGHMFDEMYVEAILNPEKVEDSVESVVARLQEQAREARTTASVLGATEDLEPGEAQRLLTHPLPHWVERMTVSYLKAHGGQAERRSQSWNLTWPDGEIYENVVFTGKEAERLPAARHLTLEEPKVRGLAMRLPRFAPGQPVPIVSIPGLSEEVQGVWSLWRIAIASMEWNRRRIMPLFLADNGMVYMPTARHVWDQLLAASTHVRSVMETSVSQAAFEKLQSAAEEHGKPIYEALVQEHRGRIAREREKADYAFAARRKTVERIGLPQVRNYRLNLLSQEERSFQEQLDQKAHAYPEMVPLLVIRVEGGGHE